MCRGSCCCTTQALDESTPGVGNLVLASLAYFVFRTGRRKWWLLSAPLAAQSIVMMFTAPLQALRYQYPVYLIAMLFTLPLLLMGWKKMKLDPVEKDIS